jgi:hypothetical protein
MHTLNAALRLVLATTVFMVLGVGAAWAPGSISLDEVMQHLKENEKLIAEINAELKTQNLEAPKVICVGSRFGGKWTDLGGARAVPYECEVGTRKLDIAGTVHIYDKDGKELDEEDDKSPERAVDYTEKDITWTWK